VCEQNRNREPSSKAQAGTWKTGETQEDCLQEVSWEGHERKVMRKGIPGRGMGRANAHRQDGTNSLLQILGQVQKAQT
jgi:hypothetical protein